MSDKDLDLIPSLLQSPQWGKARIPIGEFHLDLVKSEIIENFRVDIKVAIGFESSIFIEDEIVPQFEGKIGYKRGFNLWRGKGVIGTRTFILSPFDDLEDPDWTVNHNDFLPGQRLSADEFSHISLLRMEQFLTVICNRLSGLNHFYQAIQKGAVVSKNFYLIEPLAYIVYFGCRLGLEKKSILKDLSNLNADLDKSEMEMIVTDVQQRS